MAMSAVAMQRLGEGCWRNKPISLSRCTQQKHGVLTAS